jgi:hypothetical protein
MNATYPANRSEEVQYATPRGFIRGACTRTVQRTVFPARHAGLRSGGMGTVSDDIGCYESAQEGRE